MRSSPFKQHYKASEIQQHMEFWAECSVLGFSSAYSGTVQRALQNNRITEDFAFGFGNTNLSHNVSRLLWHSTNAENF